MPACVRKLGGRGLHFSQIQCKHSLKDQGSVVVPSAQKHTPTFTDPPKDKPPRHRPGGWGGGWLRDVQDQSQGDTSTHPCPAHPRRNQTLTEVSHSTPWRAAHGHTPTRPEAQRVQPPAATLAVAWSTVRKDGGSRQAVLSPSLLPPHPPAPISSRKESLA